MSETKTAFEVGTEICYQSGHNVYVVDEVKEYQGKPAYRCHIKGIDLEPSNEWYSNWYQDWVDDPIIAYRGSELEWKIDGKKLFADAQAVIRRQADEIAVYRTALEAVCKQATGLAKEADLYVMGRLNDPDYTAFDWGYACGAATMAEVADKALAAYPCPTGVGKIGDQEGSG